MEMKSFFHYYVKSMRLYYGFVTGATTLVGVIAALETQGTPWGWRDAVVLFVGFFAWGVNQIFNDATNLAEDRINAPERPMVTGMLNLRKAVILSTLLMVLFGAASVLLTPWTLLPILAGAGFNLLYSLLKGVPVLGCLVYGASISLCAAYGWIGSLGGIPNDRSRYGIIVLSLMLLPIHALMCHNSFFKDVPGDKAAGKRTLQVILPEKINLGFSAVLGFICNAGLFFMILGGNLRAAYFYFFFLLLLNAALILRLAGRKYHEATQLNALTCVMQIMGFAVCFSPRWMIVSGAAFLAMILLFRWYANEKE